MLTRRQNEQVKLVETPDPKGTVVGSRGPLSSTLFLTPPGVEQAPTGHSELLRWNWGTPIPLHLRREDAKMLAYGLEDGGGVVAKGLAVMVGTG